jgi:hypothetical protein
MEDTVKRKTVYFEKHYNVNIDDFKSTEEIDEFIENKIGRKLEVEKIDIFPIKKYPERDIDYVF